MGGILIVFTIVQYCAVWAIVRRTERHTVLTAATTLLFGIVTYGLWFVPQFSLTTYFPIYGFAIQCILFVFFFIAILPDIYRKELDNHVGGLRALGGQLSYLWRTKRKVFYYPASLLLIMVMTECMKHVTPDH